MGAMGSFRIERYTLRALPRWRASKPSGFMLGSRKRCRGKALRQAAKTLPCARCRAGAPRSRRGSCWAAGRGACRARCAARARPRPDLRTATPRAPAAAACAPGKETSPNVVSPAACHYKHVTTARTSRLFDVSPAPAHYAGISSQSRNLSKFAHAVSSMLIP
jgi:hypothetical protein